MSSVEEAAELVAAAHTLYVTTGAGMGVDSGLPDFRGPQGFWRAYPAYQALGLRFEELADPRWFRDDPQLAWGFYGHRLQLYRSTQPHEGYAVLARWAESRTTLVFTSNVDGQHSASGMVGDALFEVHGNIHHLQCSEPCSAEVWSNTHEVSVDPTSFRATGPLPLCPHCGAIARPNILMFGDGGFIEARAEQQATAYHTAHNQAPGPAVVVEIGAGTALPTVRHHGERLMGTGGRLVRINPRESHGPPGTVSLAMGGREGLQAIDAALGT